MDWLDNVEKVGVKETFKENLMKGFELKESLNSKVLAEIVGSVGREGKGILLPIHPIVRARLDEATQGAKLHSIINVLVLYALNQLETDGKRLICHSSQIFGEPKNNWGGDRKSKAYLDSDK